MKQLNIMIAEFMGYKHVSEYSCYVPNFGSAFYKGLNDSTEPCFNNRWDLLMPVVEIIRNSGYEYEVEDLTDEYKVSFVIYGDSESMLSTNHLSGIDDDYIKATYKAVVEFIKWKNDN